MTKREQELEQALKVATVVIVSSAKGEDKEDYIRRFGEARIKQILEETASLESEAIENVLFKALYPDAIS